MRILFIANYIVNAEFDGVAKKIKYQREAFERKGIKCDYTFVDGNEIYLSLNNKKIYICERKTSFRDSWDKMLTMINEMIDNSMYNFIYYRLDHVSYKLVKFLKINKKRGSTIFIEIPTYQKKPEPGLGVKSKIIVKYKHYIAKRFNGNVERIITFSSHSKLYGVDTICIENGVDTNSVIPIECKKYDSNLTIVAVAMMTPSHGFDRLIRGIHQYYINGGNQYIKLNIVGDGFVKNQWQQLVDKLNLNNNVFFVGKKSGKDLDELFLEANIACASLAMFRKDTPKCSELKIREYFARGIPFIYSANEPEIEKFKNLYCLNVEHNENPISIENILLFLDNINYDTVSIEMRNLAKEMFSWDRQLQKVINYYIKKDKGVH